MNRRRLKCCHLKYAMLNVMARYPEVFSDGFVLQPNVSDAIMATATKYYNEFMAKYAGMILVITSIILTIMPDFIIEHRCSYPVCRQVLVIDGNQKNRRSVCMAYAAGHLEYSSLPGTRILSGCIMTPAFKARVCEDHKVRSYPYQPNQGRTDDSMPNQTESNSEEIIELLINKRTTRNGTFYQVT